MKRSLDAAERPRRQEPVSCEFCRTKKLKCSREFPCSNCRARRIGCVPTAGAVRLTRAESNPSKSEQDNGSLSLQGLNERIQRIERTLNIPAISNGVPITPYYPLNPQNVRNGYENSLNTGHHWASTAVPNAKRQEEEKMEKEGDDLTDRVATGFSPGLNTSLCFQLWPGCPQNTFLTSQWFSGLPPYESALRLLQIYTCQVSWTYHFTHIPTLRRHLEESYQKIGDGSRPEASVLSLLFAIFAVATYFAQSSSNSEISSVGEDSYRQYVSLTYQALAEAKHIDNPTIESIQAVLLLSSSLLPNMGAMPASRVLMTTMFTSAQVLHIHQVDLPKNQRLRQTMAYDRVELEIKRRIWWYITSSDWIFAFICGSRFGSYIVHPNQMHVNLPSNADDSTITSDSCPNLPSTEPTEMSYFILRCQISVVFREFMDTANAYGLAPGEINYDLILDFDRKLHDFVESAPYFLRPDFDTAEAFKELDKQRPYLTWQRMMAQFGSIVRITRVHRPYLARGSRDPRYAYSRMVCLRSARTIIDYERRMRAESSLENRPDPSKIWAIMYHFFLAAVVLVMDHNFNKNEPRAEDRIQEIMECFRTLESAKNVSSLAARGLEELKDVMRKWGLLTDTVPKAAAPRNGLEQEGAPSRVARCQTTAEPRDNNTSNELIQAFPELPAMSTEGSGVDDQWMQSFQFDLDLDSPQWDALFHDLESRSGLY